MGLLDQVLGQVIGNMAGGLIRGLPGGREAPPPPQRHPTGSPMPGAPMPGAPMPGGGILGDLLGGATGKYSPLVLALLALLASKNLKDGAGGYGTILQDILGKLGGGLMPTSQPQGRSAPPQDEPQQDEPGGMFGQPSPRGQQDDDEVAPQDRGGSRRGGRDRGQDGGRSGGFLDSVGSMLDGPGGTSRRHASADAAQDDGNAPAIGGGLGDLLDRFRQSGHGDLIESWIGAGQNKAASPHDLESALGPDTVDQLSRGTGLGRDDLLSQLTQALPQLIDGLTPHGRMPTRDEHRSWI